MSIIKKTLKNGETVDWCTDTGGPVIGLADEPVAGAPEPITPAPVVESAESPAPDEADHDSWPSQS